MLIAIVVATVAALIFIAVEARPMVRAFGPPASTTQGGESSLSPELTLPTPRPIRITWRGARIRVCGAIIVTDKQERRLAFHRGGSHDDLAKVVSWPMCEHGGHQCHVANRRPRQKLAAASWGRPHRDLIGPGPDILEAQDPAETSVLSNRLTPRWYSASPILILGNGGAGCRRVDGSVHRWRRCGNRCGPRAQQIQVRRRRGDRRGSSLPMREPLWRSSLTP